MISADLRDKYSMNGVVQIYEKYLSRGSDRVYHHYSYELVENFINYAKAKDKDHFLGTDGWSYDRRESKNYYPETDIWLYEALEKHPISGKELLIIGSEEPYYEGIAINAGANVTMVEYQKVTSAHPRLNTMTADEFNENNRLFDGAISISSVEHSGLGRYGDPLDPDGDLKAMKALAGRLRKDGLCYLAVPIGIDQILWNAHRVYGRARLPLLIRGFEIVDSFGLVDSDFDVDEHKKRVNGNIPHRQGVSGGAHQPILVLRKANQE